MKKILIAAAVAAILSGCNPISQKEMKALTANNILDIKIPCKSAEWEAVTTFGEGKQSMAVKSRVYFREGKYRLEIFNPQSDKKQVILFDAKKLYVLGFDNTAYAYDAGMSEAEIFLRKIFVNTGLGRKAELKTGESIYGGQKCSVYEYEILRNVNGLYANAKVREWRNKKGATVKMEAAVGPAEFLLGGKKVVVGPIRETYETSKYKCGGSLMGMLFEVPVGMKTVDQKEEYAKQLKKSGKKIAPDAGIRTFTVKAKNSRK
jgi:hypothetical protein